MKIIFLDAESLGQQAQTIWTKIISRSAGSSGAMLPDTLPNPWRSIHSPCSFI